jgi:hypothetical protein
VAGRTPQDKKALSYAKDRRNAYGENDKSSRKNIRRNKRVPHRADRRREHQVLAEATGPIVEGIVDKAEDRLIAKPSKRMSWRWRKWPDRSLGEHVEDRLLRRIRLGIDDPVGARARIERVRHRREAQRHEDGPRPPTDREASRGV